MGLFILFYQISLISSFEISLACLNDLFSVFIIKFSIIHSKNDQFFQTKRIFERGLFKEKNINLVDNSMIHIFFLQKTKKTVIINNRLLFIPSS